MKVELIERTPNAEDHIVHVARVSSGRKDKKAKPEGLLNYLIEHKHFSPFEHAYMTLEIETSKAIGIQLIRHRSFTFQEFSQRYQDVTKLGDIYEPVELRKQCDNNRQSSTEVFDPIIELDSVTDDHFGIYTAGCDGYKTKASDEVQNLLNYAQNLYRQLIEAGVAREQARLILPLATRTKIYMTGSVRSWVHFLQLRDDEHAQKEIQEVAKEAKKIFIKEFPIISKALSYDE